MEAESEISVSTREEADGIATWTAADAKAVVVGTSAEEASWSAPAMAAMAQLRLVGTEGFDLVLVVGSVRWTRKMRAFHIRRSWNYWMSDEIARARVYRGKRLHHLHHCCNMEAGTFDWDGIGFDGRTAE